jgi:hypothetical protein
MQEPPEHPTTQSNGNADEALTNPPVAIPEVADSDLGGNGKRQDAVKGTPAITPILDGSKQSSNAESPSLQSPVSPESETRVTPMLDLVRRPEDGKIYVALMEFKDGSIKGQSGSEIQHNGRRYSVPRLPLALSESLILPTLLGKSASARELFDGIVVLLRKHVMLPERECSLLAYWSMATWFVDFLPFLPSVAVTGSATAADLLLRTLVAVCRRPVLLADVNPATLRALPLAELLPTLLIREPQMSKRTAALLDASNQPGYLVCSGDDFQQIYCAKCVYMGEHAHHELLTPGNIHIHIDANCQSSVPSPPKEGVIQDFQKRLLRYRFVKHDVVADWKYGSVGFRFRPEVSAMAQVLGASIVDDSELQKGVLELLQERDEQSRVDRATSRDGMVLKAVLRHCHQPDEQQVFVREIAVTTNEMYSAEGEARKVSNETVGHVLKNLGLYTRRLGNAGRGLVLDQATQARAHELGYAHEVLPGSAEGSPCGHCHNLQLLETQEVVQEVQVVKVWPTI